MTDMIHDVEPDTSMTPDGLQTQMRVLRNDIDRVLARLKAIEEQSERHDVKFGSLWDHLYALGFGEDVTSTEIATPAPASWTVGDAVQVRAGAQSRHVGKISTVTELVDDPRPILARFPTGETALYAPDDLAPAPAGDDATPQSEYEQMEAWNQVILAGNTDGWRTARQKAIALGLADPTGARRVTITPDMVIAATAAHDVYLERARKGLCRHDGHSAMRAALEAALAAHAPRVAKDDRSVTP